MARLLWLLDLVLFGHSAKEGQDLSYVVLAGGFQLALIGDADWLAIRIEKCRRRHAFFQAHTQLLSDPEVHVHFTDVYVHDFEMRLHVFADGRFVKSVVKRPTIGAPVAAKNNHQQLAGTAGALPGTLKVGSGVCRWRIRICSGRRERQHRNYSGYQNQSTR